ncbi:MAG TPA: DUF5693 family protein [Chthonomonadales bacterium]|nr:DUF5693 family protein [Chthonomonadales bacterium]
MRTTFTGRPAGALASRLRGIEGLLWAVVALGALGGLIGLAVRHRAEQANRRVELTVDLLEVRNLAMAARSDLADVLRSLREAGVTSAGIMEDTLTTLETEGKIRSERDGIATTVQVYSRPLLERIEAALSARGVRTHWDDIQPVAGQRTFTAFVAATASPDPNENRAPRSVFFVPEEYDILRPMGVAMPPDLVRLVRDVGLLPVARISTFPGGRGESYERVLREAMKAGARTVVFEGVEVFGFRGGHREAAEAFRKAGVLYGQVEFGKQRGDARLAHALDGEFVRVHSISEGEMRQLAVPDAIERYVRAARERNIRLCYLRLPGTTGADPVASTTAYVRRVVSGLRDVGLDVGPARPHRPLRAPIAGVLLAALGTAGVCALLVRRAVGASDQATLGTLVGSAVVVLALALSGEQGRQMAALLAAVAYPTLACLRRGALEGDTPAPEPSFRQPPPIRSIGVAAGWLAAATGLSILGGLAVVGLLATRAYMMKIEQFVGVKLAHVAPIALIGALAVVGLPRVGLAFAEERDRLKAHALAFLRSQVRVGVLIAALAAVVGLALVVMRTGNDPGVGVSGLELRIRSLLDLLLPVRPRTKEFLIGHPALLLGAVLLLRGRPAWGKPLFVLGVLGQVSVVNTFCHLHTPVMLSMVRALTGVVLGGLLGAGVAALLLAPQQMRRRGRGVRPEPAQASEAP